MKPFQDAFGSFWRVDGKSSDHKSTKLFLTQRVEAQSGFDDCALRGDDQPQDDDVITPLSRSIITFQLTDLLWGGLEVELARKRQYLLALSSLSCIQCAGQMNGYPKFLPNWIKRRISIVFINSAVYRDRPNRWASSRINLLQVLLAARCCQGDIASTWLNQLNLPRVADLPFSISVF